MPRLDRVVAIDGLLSVVFLGFWLFCLFDVITTDQASVRNLPKILWLLVVAVLFALGGLLWFLLGRPSRRGGSLPGTGPGSRLPWTQTGGTGSTTARPLGPEDSPEYEERMRRAQERLLRRPDDDPS